MSGETSKLTSSSKGGDQKQTQSGQSRREDITYWRQNIRQQYPKLAQGTHFVPPLHFPRGDYAGSSTHHFPSFPTSTPSGSKFTEPSEKKFPYTYEERMLTSSMPESNVLDGQQRFLYGLRDLAEKTQEVMMVLSQMKFGQYVNKPSYAAAADTFLGQSANIKERTPGEKDVLIINKQYGLISGEIRDVQMTEHEKDVSILATIQEAITKLNDSEGVLKQLVSFMLDVNVIKTLILPSVTSDQLSRVLSKDVKTQEDLCRCLGVRTLTEALELCLLADDTAPSMSKLKARPGSLTQMESWWLRLLKQTRYKVDMMDSEYEHLVAMFCGPATTVQLHLVTPPRLGFQTRMPTGEKPYTGTGEKAYTDIGNKPFTNIGEKPYKYIGEETYTNIGEKAYTDIGEKPYKYIEEKPYTDIGESPYIYTGEKPYTDTGDIPIKYIGGKPYTDTGEIPIKYIGGKPYTDTSEGKDTPAVKKSRIFHRPTITHSEFDDDDFIDQTFHPSLMQPFHSGEAHNNPEPVSSETVGHPEPVSSEIGNTSDLMSGESPSVKPIFSETWQMCQTFTSSTGQMQGKDSDIVLFVPEGAIEQQDEVIVQGAVCTDLKTVHQELRLEDSETIVSPVVEYYTDHLGEFQKPVNIYLPLFIPSTSSPAESLRVYRFFKSENGSVDKEQLPYKTLEEEKTAGKSGKENERFFYLTETRQICVVALHFCGFVCSCDRELKPGPLHLRLYGVHRQRKTREAIFCLYFWDGRLEIKDFQNEHVCGQEQELKVITVDILDPIPNDTDLQLGACLKLKKDDEKMWKHSETTAFQTKSLGSIYMCFSTNSFVNRTEDKYTQQGNSNRNGCYGRKPMRIHWFLENKTGCIPEIWFRCTIQVGYVKGDKRTQFLKIPQSLMLPVRGLELEKQPNANAGIQTEPDPCSMTHVKELNNRHPIIEPTAVPTPVLTSSEPNAVSTQVHSNTIPNVDSMPLNSVNDPMVDSASGFQTTPINQSHTTIQSVTINNYVNTSIKRVKGSVDLACNRMSETSNARDSTRGLCGLSSTSNAGSALQEPCGPSNTLNVHGAPREVCGSSSPVASEGATYSPQGDLQNDRLEKEYNDRLVQIFRPDFVKSVDPKSLIFFLPPGSLSTCEEEMVLAELSRNGPTIASYLLLKLLSRHENWVQNLSLGLRHDEILLEHLAEKLEHYKVNLMHS